ncbi:MAG: hypothetical protein H6732_08655 [Alphaproteobacteria bacterium]|nr:hypothetical protein [Alphaproteobacteria bacterium]
MRALRQALTLLGDDPVRLLGLGALGALADVAGALLLVRALWAGTLTLALAAGLLAARVGVAVVVDGLTAALAAGALGRQASAARSVVQAAGAHAMGLLVGLPGGILLALPGLVAAGAILAQGGAPVALLPVAAAVLGAWVGSLPGRALAHALLARAVLEPRRGAGRLRRAAGDLPVALPLSVAGDLLRACGTLAFVVPALPAHPLPLLALVVRRAAALPTESV